MSNSVTFLTANDLRTGLKVYWTSDGLWTTQAGLAQLATSEEAVAQLQSVIARPETDIEVVGAYLVKANTNGNDDAAKAIEPNQGAAALAPETMVKLRERQRLKGPSPSTTSIQSRAA